MTNSPTKAEKDSELIDRGPYHTCPNCDHELASDGPQEVYAEIRASDDGLRLGVQCVCGNCGTPLLLEDAGTTDGVLGEFPDHARFDGGDYRI
jgi:hypothetical protein